MTNDHAPMTAKSLPAICDFKMLLTRIWEHQQQQRNGNEINRDLLWWATTFSQPKIYSDLYYQLFYSLILQKWDILYHSNEIHINDVLTPDGDFSKYDMESNINTLYQQSLGLMENIYIKICVDFLSLFLLWFCHSHTMLMFVNYRNGKILIPEMSFNIYFWSLLNFLQKKRSRINVSCYMFMSIL